MTTEHAMAFALFAIVAAITPGPSNVLLTSTGATVGVLRGLPTLSSTARDTSAGADAPQLACGYLVLYYCGRGYLLDSGEACFACRAGVPGLAN